MKLQKPLDWETKINFAGLILILLLLIYLTTQYCTTCNPVHQSVYGHPLGIPLSVYGIAYVILLIGLQVKGSRWFYPALCFSLAVSFALVVIQALVLRRYCPYCLTCEGLFFILWSINHYSHKKLLWIILVGLMAVSFIGLGYLMDYVFDNSVHYVSTDGVNPVYPVYDWNGSPAEVEIGGAKDVYIISTTCRHCLELIKGFSPQEWDKVYVVDIYSEHGLKAEKKLLEGMGARPDHMYFDLVHNISVKTVPYIYKGKESK